MRAIAATPEYRSGDPRTEAEYYRLHYGSTLRRPEHLDVLIHRLRAHFTTEGILKARAIEERLYSQTWNRPEYDLVPKLAHSAAPILVIHSRYDFVPLECADHIAGRLRGASMVRFEDCGHFTYMERPADTFMTILDHLSRRPSPPPSRSTTPTGS
jgi:pimeloyl-ACP methyl ester carboxylesterase